MSCIPEVCQAINPRIPAIPGRGGGWAGKAGAYNKVAIIPSIPGTRASTDAKEAGYPRALAGRAGLEASRRVAAVAPHLDKRSGSYEKPSRIKLC